MSGFKTIIGLEHASVRAAYSCSEPGTPCPERTRDAFPNTILACLPLLIFMCLPARPYHRHAEYCRRIVRTKQTDQIQIIYLLMQKLECYFITRNHSISKLPKLSHNLFSAVLWKLLIFLSHLYVLTIYSICRHLNNYIDINPYLGIYL